MTIITPPPSIWAAHEEALNSHLAIALGIPFDYPALRTDLSNSPRGNVAIARCGFEVGSSLRKSDPVADVRIVVCHDDPVEGRRLLLDWGYALSLVMEDLYLNGITGTYRSIALSNAFRAIKLIQDMEFQSEDYPQQASSLESVFNGLVVGRYTWPIEQVEFY